MQYFEYQLTDMGYDDPRTDPVEHIESIEGRDNKAQPFVHNGVVGYPAGALRCIDSLDRTKTLALFNGVPGEGGAEVAEVDVLNKLKADYGFPPETIMGADGLPMVSNK